MLGLYLVSAFILGAIFLIPVYGSILFFYQDWQKEILVFNSIFALLSVWVWFSVPKKIGFWFGFFVGLGLFYWIGLSFRFSVMEFLIPIIMVGVGVGYGIIFYFLLWFPSWLYRMITLMIMSYIHPFGFDWMVVESFFSYSIFGVDKLHFLCIIVGVGVWIHFKRFYRIFAVCFLLFGIDWGHINGEITLPLKVEVTTTHVSQDSKWQSQNFQKIIDKNFDLIDQAILKGKDIVVLPETAFPIVLNKSILKEVLEKLSSQISIVTGGLREEKGKIYNSTYLFENGDFSFIDKVVLAPFGEKIPLPDFLARPLYKAFFGKEYGLSEGKIPENFQIKGDVFRSAICYEGTSKIMYQDKPKYMILISNNGWFVPSIEPFFQRMLVKYYARIYKSIVIHSINQSSSYILSPSVLGDKLVL
ncbi:apolipoprotein N-acyltransferase [Helicobacter sp. 11S03491-1]|nr:apolipoprotein N-acyltransferase [Helicobacter sp. 11S03491-1]